MKHNFFITYRFILPVAWVLSFALLLMSADNAWAQAFQCNGTNAPAPCFAGNGLPGTCQTDGTCLANSDPDGTCTSNPDPTDTTPNVYDIDLSSAGTDTGIIEVIVLDVTCVLTGGPKCPDPTDKGIAGVMYYGLANDIPLQKTIEVVLILCVMFYGMSFMLGMVQLTVFDFFLRMVKICLVAMLLSGGLLSGNGRDVIFDKLTHFFNDGTNHIIGAMNIMALNSAGTYVAGDYFGATPFQTIDDAILYLSSAKVMAMFLAASSTGPYCIIIIGILTISAYTFIKSMLYALWVYIAGLTMRTLLFGLAPMFIVCLLFSRTRHLFDGWLNQIINSCLQPIFLFAFFSFFVQMILSEINLILYNTHVCWTEQALIEGAPNDAHYWRFAVWSCKDRVWVPFVGQWNYDGPVNPNTGCSQNNSSDDDYPDPQPAGQAQPDYPSDDENPIGIMVPITLWILTELAKRFNVIIVTIAKDISNSSISFPYRGGAMFGRAISGGQGYKPNPLQKPRPRTSPASLSPQSFPSKPSKPSTTGPSLKNVENSIKKNISELSNLRDKKPLPPLGPPPS